MSINDLNELAYIVSKKDEGLIKPVTKVDKVSKELKKFNEEDLEALKITDVKVSKILNFDQMLQDETAKLIEQDKRR